MTQPIASWRPIDARIDEPTDSRTPAPAARFWRDPPPPPLASIPERFRHGPVAAPEDAARLATRSRLDAFMTAMSGPYLTPQGALAVPAPFRMTVARPSPQIARHAPLVERARVHAGLSPGDVRLVESGRASPGQIRALTQAVIDVARPAEVPASVGPDGRIRWTAAAIRTLMFDCGIGVDCASYVQQASLRARGVTRVQAGFRPPLDEDLSNLEARGFARVTAVADLRPGDIAAFGPAGPGDVGHRAIVYDARRVTAAQVPRELLPPGADGAPDRSRAPSVLVQVDSSWGAWDRPLLGGVRRETWGYRESNGEWTWLGPLSGGATLITGAEVYDHPLVGFFRVPASPAPAPPQNTSATQPPSLRVR